MIDLRRYASFALVGLSLSAIAAVFHVALSGSFGREPAWLVDPNPVDWNYYQLFGRQVAGAEWEADRAPARVPRRFGALIGASSIQRGPLPDVMEARTGLPWLLLGIGGGTGAFSKLRRSIPVLSQAGLRPTTVLLGVHTFLLCRSPRVSDARRDPLDAVWFVGARKLVSNHVYARLQEVRERMLARPDGGTWAVFPPAPNPWRPAPELPFDTPLSERELAEHRERSAAAGRFDSTHYDASSEPFREMIAVVSELRRLSPDTTVLLMPEHSKYRNHVPESATALLKATLDGAFSARPPRVVDLRSSLPDRLFWDNYHLTMEGRRELSRLLADIYQGST